MLIGLAATLVATILGTLLAFALVRHDFVARSTMNLLIFMPMASPEIVMGSSLLALFVAAGFAGQLGIWTILIAHIMFCLSFVVVTVRARLAGMDDPLVTHFWTGAVGTAIVLPVLWVSPVDVAGVLAAATPRQWAALIVAGLAGTFGHLLLILALGLAPASTLMPFVYVQIASATAVGWWVFGVLPDRWGWLGMALVGVSGAATAWLNLRGAERPRRPQDTVAADTIAD